MPQSLARLHAHLVFSTKNRRRFLQDTIQTELHAYLATALQSLGCNPVLINSAEDHVHLLFELSRTRSVSQVVEELKKTSSKWLKTRGPAFDTFYWQAGYGIFAVSESHVPAVRDYIADQQEHHRKVSFQEEYRALPDRHGVPYDERYVWD